MRYFVDYDFQECTKNMIDFQGRFSQAIKVTKNLFLKCKFHTSYTNTLHVHMQYKREIKDIYQDYFGFKTAHFLHHLGLEKCGENTRS